MLIKEILELSKTQNIAAIAKEHLPFGEKTARNALKLAGCYHINGIPGWLMDSDADISNLEKPLFDFAIQWKDRNELELRTMANLGTLEDTLFIPRKRHSFDLDLRLVKELKLHCVRTDKTLYEVVEEALRQYLKDNK